MNKIGYENSFWGGDFTSSSGYDALVKRMEEGRSSCKMIGEFFKQRAKAEDDYAKSLQRICRSMTDINESGSLITSWDIMKVETENMAQTHLETSTYFAEMAAKITEFHKNQKMERKNKEDIICNLAKEKASYYKKTADAKRTYDNKSQDAELAENVLKKAKANEGSYPTKEWDKIVTRSAKALQDANKADSSYKELVMKLDEIRITWEKEMKDYCNICEHLDETRIKFLLEQMWAAANVISANCLEFDGGCENIRQSVEKVSIEGDMRSFVNRCQTGSEKPAQVKYETYRSQFSSSSSLTSSTSSSNTIMNNHKK